MQMQMRLLLKEQSDQGHCLPFCLYLLDASLCGKTTLLKFLDNYRNVFMCPNFEDLLIQYSNGPAATGISTNQYCWQLMLVTDRKSLNTQNIIATVVNYTGQKKLSHTEFFS